LRADPTAWHAPAYRYRRALLAEPARTSLPGDEVCWAVIPTHGRIRSQNDPIAVFSAYGTELPCRILSVGPGDQMTICFAAKPKLKKYFVYYDLKSTRSSRRNSGGNWQPKRGLLLESRTYRRGPINSLAQVKRLFAQGKLQGRTFVPNVFFGYNPLGPPANYIHRYVGWLICPVDGTYRFATTSDDASFLLIDDGLVVQWPGRHRWRADAKHNAPVRLTKGLHKFEYWHVNVGPYGGAVAAWQPPGAERFSVIPPQAFAPAIRCKLADLDRSDRKPQPDFTFRPQGMAFFANRYSFRWIFAASMSGTSVKADDCLWDFGDGCKVTGRTIEHVYLKSGTYRVTLTIRRAGRSYSISNRVAVNILWDRLIYARLDALDRHCDILKTYGYATVRQDLLLNALLLADRAERRDLIDGIAPLLAGRYSSCPRQDAESFIEICNRRFVQKGDPQQAARLLARLENTAEDPSTKSLLAWALAKILLHDLGQPQAAATSLQRALSAYASSADEEIIRKCKVLLGDTYAQLGRIEDALRLYRDAQRSAEADSATVGALIRSAEDYIRRGEFDAAETALEDVEYRCPTQKILGYTPLLRARIYAARQMYPKVIRIADTLVHLNPRSNHAPALLLLKARALQKMSRSAEATNTLKQILSRYPESPEAQEARKLLHATPAGQRPA